MLLLCLALSGLSLLIAALLYLLTPLVGDRQWRETSMVLFLVLGGVGPIICSACLLWLCVSVRLRFILLGVSFTISGIAGLAFLFSDDEVSIFEQTFGGILSLVMLPLGLMGVGAWLVHYRRGRDQIR